MVPLSLSSDALPDVCVTLMQRAHTVEELQLYQAQLEKIDSQVGLACMCVCLFVFLHSATKTAISPEDRTPRWGWGVGMGVSASAGVGVGRRCRRWWGTRFRKSLSCLGRVRWLLSGPVQVHVCLVLREARSGLCLPAMHTVRSQAVWPPARWTWVACWDRSGRRT